MVFYLHRPVPPLGNLVEDIFYYEAGVAPYEAEKLLPDNTVYLIINFTEEPKKLYTDTTLAMFTAYKKAWVSGMQRKYIVIEATNNNCMMVVRFKPGGAYPLLNMPVSIISETVLESDDVLGNKIIALREEMLGITCPAAKCRRMEQFLLQEMRGRADIHPVVGYVAESLTSGGSVRIKDIIEKTGYSHRHVLELFERYTGLTPKYFARIEKFRRVLKEIDRSQSISWASLANEYGFYDQAHFINEFRNFSGINPTAYLTEKGDTYNYLPVHYTAAR